MPHQNHQRHGNMNGRMWLIIGILVVCLSAGLSSQAHIDNNQLAQGFDNSHRLSRSLPILQRKKRGGSYCTSNSECPFLPILSSPTGCLPLGICPYATCNDGKRDGLETGIDCGGALCLAARLTCGCGQGCLTPFDCTSQSCKNWICQGNACNTVNCSANGGGGICAECVNGTNSFMCFSCSYGSNVTNGPCPQSPCVSSANCNSLGGGGMCTAAGDGTAHYTCSACLYGSSVTNGPCPQSPCVSSANCTSAGGGGTCTAAGDGTADYTCSACLYGSSVTNGPCPQSPCVSLANCTSLGGGGMCTPFADGTANYTCSACNYGSNVTNGACPPTFTSTISMTTNQITTGNTLPDCGPTYCCSLTYKSCGRCSLNKIVGSCNDYGYNGRYPPFGYAVFTNPNCSGKSVNGVVSCS